MSDSPAGPDHSPAATGREPGRPATGADGEHGHRAATDEDREHGHRAGTDEGTATHLTGIIGRVAPTATGPGASVVHRDDTTKIVAFEFDPGQELPDHAAFHPVLIQLLRGRVEFGLPDRTLELEPGQIVHLTPRLRHRVTALEPTTLLVTMLLPRP